MARTITGGPQGVPPGEVRYALKRVLDGEQFARAKRSGALLAYLVERVLDGTAESIKEYTLAVEVFGRDASFDPRADSLVRVEATRLRKRLKAHYEGSGAADPVRIELPAGSYIPLVRPAAAPRPARPHPRLLLAAAAVAAIAGVGTYMALTRQDRGLALTGLRRITLDSGMSGFPAVARGGQWLAYASDRGDRSHLKLWLQPPGSGHAVQLTSGDYEDVNPAVSPDGQWIAFESRQVRDSIRLMPARGGASRVVANFGRDPRFSPDSKWISYWVPAPISGFGKVYVLPLGQPKEPLGVAREFDDAHNPVWMPDGEHLLFCGTRRSGGGPDEEHSIWVAPVNGGPAVNTRAFESLSRAGLDPHTKVLSRTSFQFHRGRLLLAADSGDSTGIWEMPLSERPWRVSGPPRRLTEETTTAIHPSVADGEMAFSSVVYNSDIWSAPLDVSRARVTGALLRQTTNAGDDMSPALSRNGAVLVFLSSPPSRSILKKKEFPSGREASLGPITGFANRLRVSADGKTAFYRVLEGSGSVKRQAIYSAELESGLRRRICEDCGAPTQAAPDGRLLIYETGSQAARLAAVRIHSGEKWDFLQHSHHATKSGRVSPDGRWIVFALDRGLDGIQLYVAPFRDAAPVAESSWKPLTAGGGMDQEPWWSPDERYVYFLSDRDGRRCVWAVPFDARQGTAAGPPHEVLPLHEPRLSPLTHVGRAPFYVGLSVSQDKLVLSLDEISSSIWTARLEP